MADQEIDKLARELADELYNNDKTYNSILWWHNEPKERKAEELVYTLHFLLRSHCIVEKSKLIEKRAAAMEHVKYVDNIKGSALWEQTAKQHEYGKVFGVVEIIDELLGSQLGKEVEKCQN